MRERKKVVMKRQKLVSTLLSAFLLANCLAFRTSASEIESLSISDLQHERTALESPGRDRQALQCPHGSDDSCYEKTGRCHRSPESGRPDGMGAPHELHP